MAHENTQNSAGLATKKKYFYGQKNALKGFRGIRKARKKANKSFLVTKKRWASKEIKNNFPQYIHIEQLLKCVFLKMKNSLRVNAVAYKLCIHQNGLGVMLRTVEPSVSCLPS